MIKERYCWEKEKKMCLFWPMQNNLFERIQSAISGQININESCRKRARNRGCSNGWQMRHGVWRGAEIQRIRCVIMNKNPTESSHIKREWTPLPPKNQRPYEQSSKHSRANHALTWHHGCVLCQRQFYLEDDSTSNKLRICALRTYDWVTKHV